MSGQKAAKLQTSIGPLKQIAIEKRQKEANCLPFRMVISVFQYFEFYITKVSYYIPMPKRGIYAEYANNNRSKIKNVICVREPPMNNSYAKLEAHISVFDISRAQ